MSDLIWDMDDYTSEDGGTDWAAVFGVDPEDMVEPAVGPVKIPVQKKQEIDTVEYGEYGERMKGIRSMQVVKHSLDPVWYRVDYVIESLSNIGGTLEVLDVKKFTDEFGMSSWTFEPVEDWEFKHAEFQLKKMFADMGGFGRY